MRRFRILAAMLAFVPCLVCRPSPAGAQELEMWTVWAGGGSGTGTIIKGPNGTVVLFDEGGGSAWASYCSTLLGSLGINRIDYAVATHYDADHINGARWLVQSLGQNYFGAFLDRGGTLCQDGSDVDVNYLNAVSGKRVTVALDGSSDIDLGNGAALRFLTAGAPDTTNTLYVRGRPNVDGGMSENNKSVTCLVTYGGFDMYLGGDAEGTNEAQAALVIGDLGRGVDVMLVDHHGSATNGISSPQFLSSISPEAALICIWPNAWQLPNKATVSNLDAVVEKGIPSIIRLDPGDNTPPNDNWAPEDYTPQCYTANAHVYVHTEGSTWSIATLSVEGDLTALITGHATDDTPLGQPTWTPTVTPTRTPTPTPTATVPPRAVVINEIAWGGTAASTADEWVELHNTTGGVIDLSNWSIATAGGTFCTLTGSIAANGYYLIERTDDTTVGDIPADRIGGTVLNNAGGLLRLMAGASLIDEVDCSGGWFAGSASPTFYTMERKDPGVSGNSAENWAQNDGTTRNGLDANGNPLNGTARFQNSVYAGTPAPTHTPTITPTPTLTPTITPTPTPTLTPTRTPTRTPTPTPTPSPTPTATPPPGSVVINEVAWGGTAASTADEWIELHNTTGGVIYLSDWSITTGKGTYCTLTGSIAAKGYYLIERTDDTTVGDIPADRIGGNGLNNTGENLTLLLGATVMDQVNCSGGWFAGTASPGYYTMERKDPAVSGNIPENWARNDGTTRNGLDAYGNPLNGTARAQNSVYSGPTPTPTITPTPSPTPTIPMPARVNFQPYYAPAPGDEWMVDFGDGFAAGYGWL